MTLWNFYLPDSDRNAAWTNHGYVLQHVVAGEGDTPEQAWATIVANDELPEHYEPEGETLVAINNAHETTLQT